MNSLVPLAEVDVVPLASFAQSSMFDFSKNHFELFGLPVGFRLDREQLDTRYRSLQRALHPDRYANATDQEKRLSMQAATRVNEAYNTLKDALARARYLLELHGLDLGADNETTKDAAFLMQQMELREALEAARSRPDPYAHIADLLVQINRDLKTLSGQLALSFETPTPDQLEAAREAVIKMQFLQKCRADAEHLEAQLDEAY